MNFNTDIILQTISNANYAISEEIELHKAKVESLKQEKVKAMNSIFDTLQLVKHEEVVLSLLPSRDDTVSLATGHIELAMVYIDSFVLYEYQADKPAFIVPVLLWQTSSGKLSNKRVVINGYLNWQLFNSQGDLLLEHVHEDIIVPGKFTDEQIAYARTKDSYKETYRRISVTNHSKISYDKSKLSNSINL